MVKSNYYSFENFILIFCFQNAAKCVPLQEKSDHKSYLAVKYSFNKTNLIGLVHWCNSFLNIMGAAIYFITEFKASFVRLAPYLAPLLGQKPMASSS